MSQYVQRATGLASRAMEVAKTRVLPPAVEYYNATMAKNAEYVVKDPAAVDKLGRQLVFSNLAKCVRPRFARATRPSDAIDTPGATRAPPRAVRAGRPPDPTPPVLPPWTHLASRMAHTPTPHPTIDRLPGMVEAAQGEMKVVQQKWANRMELPMTEVRPPPRRDPRPPREIAPTRSHPPHERGTVRSRAVCRFPNRNFAARQFAFATEATD